MTKTKHTAEPWDYVEGRTKLLHIETRHDNTAGAGLPVCSIPKARKEDAARIVACVNACAGIEDPGKAIHLAGEAIRKILRHIPADAGGASISADVHLCNTVLRLLGVK